MPTPKGRKSVHAAAQCARDTILADSQSSFASLAIMASLRTGLNGAYIHHTLVRCFGENLIHDALAKLHSEIFHKWLKTPLDDQDITVNQHLASLGKSPADQPALSWFGAYIPASAELPERQLFETDLSIILMRAALQRRAAAMPSQHLFDLIKSTKRSIRPTKLTLRELAARMALSPNYVGSLFRDRTGISFNRYAFTVRMVTAADLLRSQTISLKRISEQLGYGDTSNFFRDFRRAFRTSPTLFRLRATGV